MAVRTAPTGRPGPGAARPAGQYRLSRIVLQIALLTVGLLAVWLLAKVLLVIFAGILLAILLRGLAGWLVKRIPLPMGAALALVVLGLLAAMVATGYFLAPRASAQLNQLFVSLPQEVNRLESELASTSWGQVIVSELQPGSGAATTGVVGHVFGAATTTLDVIAGMVVIVFIGLYLAADPETYLAGTLRLVPLERRPRIAEVLFESTRALQGWLIGRILSMLIIAILTAVGLWLLGINLALLLGLLAGTLAFVPYVGSIASAIPAILVALAQSTTSALYVALLYTGVHLVEGYILAPLLQQRMVHQPPALTLAAQALLGSLFGILGLTLATPLAAIAVVAIQLLYVEDVLHDDLDRPVIAP
jgi:predicted PurR-regulated permease PerM